MQQQTVKRYTKLISQADTAAFEAGSVHPVYSTFALGRDAEWVCRLFVLDMKGEDEEGIGTFLKVEHLTPALEGSMVEFSATIAEVVRNTIICNFEARVGERLVATGQTGQKILKKEKLRALFASLK